MSTVSLTNQTPSIHADTFITPYGVEEEAHIFKEMNGIFADMCVKKLYAGESLTVCSHTPITNKVRDLTFDSIDYCVQNSMPCDSTITTDADPHLVVKKIKSVFAKGLLKVTMIQKDHGIHEGVMFFGYQIQLGTVGRFVNDCHKLTLYAPNQNLETLLHEQVQQFNKLELYDKLQILAHISNNLVSFFFAKLPEHMRRSYISSAEFITANQPTVQPITNPTELRSLTIKKCTASLRGFNPFSKIPL